MLRSAILSTFILLLASLSTAPILSPASAEIRLPEMGDSSRTVFGDDESRRIGRQLLAELRRRGEILEDPDLTEYLENVGYRLIASTEHSAADFTFLLIDDPRINAFAMPGGIIGVNSGLILATRNESELAAVIAHEIAHILQHHIARRLEDSARMSLPMTAALIAAAILGAGNPEVGEAAVAATVAGQAQMQLDFSREHEQEADRTGIDMLARAGFDPVGMPSFFERLQREQRFFSDTLPEFLRTHPVTTSRIADSRGRAEQMSATAHTDSHAYLIARARLRVQRAANPHALIREIQDNLGSGRFTDENSERFALALALRRVGRTDAARIELERLLAADPRQAHFSALADLEIAEGTSDRALALYRRALTLYPGNTGLGLALADVLTRTGEPQEAIRILRGLDRGQRPEYYRQLARAETALGNEGAAHFALGEYHHARGELSQAVEQLRIARSKPDLDFFDSSRVEARLEEVEAELAKGEKR